MEYGLQFFPIKMCPQACLEQYTRRPHDFDPGGHRHASCLLVIHDQSQVPRARKCDGLGLTPVQPGAAHQAFHEAAFPSGGASHLQPTTLQGMLELFHAAGADGIAGINGFRFHDWTDEHFAVEIVQEFQAPKFGENNQR